MRWMTGLAAACLLQAPPSGDAEIQGAGITIRTTKRLAGAIDSLRWNGKEFVDSAYHGRWRFAAEKVVKWNCDFRVKRPEGVPPGDYAYRHYVPVGTLDDVVASMRKLHEIFPAK